MIIRKFLSVFIVPMLLGLILPSPLFASAQNGVIAKRVENLKSLRNLSDLILLKGLSDSIEEANEVRKYLLDNGVSLSKKIDIKLKGYAVYIQGKQFRQQGNKLFFNSKEITVKKGLSSVEQIKSIQRQLRPKAAFFSLFPKAYALKEDRKIDIAAATMAAGVVGQNLFGRSPFASTPAALAAIFISQGIKGLNNKEAIDKLKQNYSISCTESNITLSPLPNQEKYKPMTFSRSKLSKERAEFFIKSYLDGLPPEEAVSEREREVSIKRNVESISSIFNQACRRIKNQKRWDEERPNSIRW